MMGVPCGLSDLLYNSGRGGLRTGLAFGNRQTRAARLKVVCPCVPQTGECYHEMEEPNTCLPPVNPSPPPSRLFPDFRYFLERFPGGRSTLPWVLTCAACAKVCTKSDLTPRFSFHPRAAAGTTNRVRTVARNRRFGEFVCLQGQTWRWGLPCRCNSVYLRHV